MKRILQLAILALITGVAYLLTWPVPIDPVAWNAPQSAGYTGAFAQNTALSAVQRIDIGDDTGPEDAAIGPDGLVYIPTHDGTILRYNPADGQVEPFAETNGRPLGAEFGPGGVLYVADAYRGLLSVTPDGTVTLLTDTTTDGSPILYADDVDVTADGVAYFSDASTKFGAKDNGGTLAASLLDLMEHGPNGRILRYDPATGETTTIADGYSFANGVALTADEQHLLVVETGGYAVHKMAVDGTGAAPILTNLPGFPDNINRAPDGTFWVGLVSPRNDDIDGLSGSPEIRKIIQRLPAAIRPAPERYGHVFRMDENGQVLESLQDPAGGYALTTGLIEGPDGVNYITSLTEPDLGVLQR